MNNKINNTKQQFFKALDRFYDVMQIPVDEYIRDSAIQRFEFIFELFWKLLKVMLEEKGVHIYSPRDAIKNAFQVRILEQADIWLEMLETRNQTSHIYNEKMAISVYTNFPKFLTSLKKFKKSII